MQSVSEKKKKENVLHVALSHSLTVSPVISLRPFFLSFFSFFTSFSPRVLLHRLLDKIHLSFALPLVLAVQCLCYHHVHTQTLMGPSLLAYSRVS